MGSVLIIFGNCCLPLAAWLVRQPSNPSASSVHHGGCSRWQGQAAQLFRLRRAASFCWMVTPVGLEPTIPGSVGRCLIHWATGPLVEHFRIFYMEVTHLGGQQRMKMQVTPMMGRGGEYLSKMFRSMPLALQGTALSCTETWAAALGL